ncbi:MAG: diguanylate cyclase [Shewanellaceae bacterium]|nr:diguanylate cyclase [Shewanellaceae bacterium]
MQPVITKQQFLSAAPMRVQEVMNLSPHHWTTFSYPIFAFSTREFWYKVTLLGSQIKSPAVFLEIENLKQKQIDVFEIRDQQPSRLQANIALPSSQLYEISNKPSQPHIFLIKMIHIPDLSFKINLWEQTKLIPHIQKKSLFQGLQFGMILALSCFSLFMALASKSFSFGFFCSLCLTLAALIASVYGYIPNGFCIGRFHINIMLLLGIFLLKILTYFTQQVLYIHKQRFEIIQNIARTRWLVLCLCILYPFHIFIPSIFFFIYFSVICLMLCRIGFQCSSAIKTKLLAKFYLISWVPLAISLMIISSQLFFTPWFLDNIYSILFLGLILQVITFTALLAERQHLERVENEQHQREKLQCAFKKLQEAHTQLEELNTIDSLTGSKNKLAFEDYITNEAELSRLLRQPLSIIMLDLDHFKNINDQFGHLAGDYALKEVVKIIQTNLKRPKDFLARFGGEELSIALPNTDEDSGHFIATNICNAIAQMNLNWEGNTIPLTASLGICSAILSGKNDVFHLVQLADNAMYQAKFSGRNQVKTIPFDVILLNQPLSCYQIGDVTCN